MNSCVQGSGSDIIKIALYKVWKWIRENGMQEDVRILMPIHDEIVFEIKEEKLQALVPEICEIMSLRETVKELGWEIPLEVDAEYGDSFHVNRDFWEEYKKESASLEESASAKDDKEPGEIPSEDTVEESDPSTAEPRKEEAAEKENEEKGSPSKQGDDGIYNSTYNEGPQLYCRVTVDNGIGGQLTPSEQARAVLERSNEKKKAPPLFERENIEELIDKQGFFNYTLEVDPIVARRLRFIIDTLTSASEKVFVGPRYKICLLSTEGEVLHKTNEEISLDGFLALCLAFNI